MSCSIGRPFSVVFQHAAGTVKVDPRDFRTAAVIADRRDVALKSGGSHVLQVCCRLLVTLQRAAEGNHTRRLAASTSLVIHVQTQCVVFAASKSLAERSTLDFSGTADVAHVAAFSALSARSIKLQVDFRSWGMFWRILHAAGIRAAVAWHSTALLKSREGSHASAYRLLVAYCCRAWHLPTHGQACHCMRPASHCGPRCAATPTPR